MLPQHIAIIMDGNGRWAQARGRPRIWGHIRGSQRVKPIITECGRIGVKYLTLFAFSSENWGRPEDEVGVLMKILRKFLIKERKTLIDNNVRLRAIGDLSKLPETAQKILFDTIRLTEGHTGLTLTFALSYGARTEILDAVKNVSQAVRDGKLEPSQIDESLFSKFLWSSYMPDPELIIRTSGERRISNFLLWQAAYSELFFSQKMWPEFGIEDLHQILKDFGSRKRRFGLTEAQILESRPT